MAEPTEPRPDLVELLREHQRDEKRMHGRWCLCGEDVSTGLWRHQADAIRAAFPDHFEPDGSWVDVAGLRAELDETQSDLVRVVQHRNDALATAALDFQPGPDGQDNIDRRRIVQKWVDEAWADLDSSAEHIAKVQARAVRAESALASRPPSPPEGSEGLIVFDTPERRWVGTLRQTPGRMSKEAHARGCAWQNGYAWCDCTAKDDDLRLVVPFTPGGAKPGHLIGCVIDHTGPTFCRDASGHNLHTPGGES